MTNLGTSPSVLIYQAERIFSNLPSGAFNGPSTMYLVPKIVFSSRATSLSDACCFSARASASHRSRSKWGDSRPVQKPILIIVIACVPADCGHGESTSYRVDRPVPVRLSRPRPVNRFKWFNNVRVSFSPLYILQK